MAPPKSSRKRKDAPSPPVSPQSSKQQQLLEARSQAKAWADAKRDQKKQTIISPVNHSKVAAVERVAKRPKTESAAKRPKPEDEEAKKSKKEVLREARERATAWAEETANLKKAHSSTQQQQHDESLPEVPPAYRALVASQLRHATAAIDSNNNQHQQQQQQQQQQEKLSVLEEQQRQLLERQKRLHQQRLSFLEEQQKIQQPPQQQKQRHEELRQSEQESLQLQQKLFEERQKLLEEEHRHSLEEQRRQEERERLQEQEHYERRLMEEKQHQQRLKQQNEALQQRLKRQTLSNTERATDKLQTLPYSTQTQQEHNRLDQQRQLHHEQQHTLQRETQILQHRLRDNKPDTQHTAEPFPDTFYDTKSTPFSSLKQEEQEHSLHYSSTPSTLWDTVKETLPVGFKFVGLMLLFFFFVAIVYLVILSTSPFWAPTAANSKQMLLLGNGDKRSEPLTPPPPPCFKTEGFDPPFSESWSCLNPVDPCPEHGRCQNGVLVDCNLGVNEIGETYPPTLFFNGNILTLYVVQNGDRCVPSSFCAELMEGLKTKVVDLTVEQACTLWSNCSIQREYIGKRIVAEEDDNGDGPLFASNGIADLLDLESTDVIGQLVREVNKNVTLPHDKHMLTLLPPEDAKTVDHHHLMRKNVTMSSSWIGLTPYYMTKKLSIPFFCYMRLLLWDMTLSLLSVIVSFTQGILRAFYRVGRAYPIVTIVTFLVLYVGRWIQVRRSSRAKLRERVHSVRELVNEKLVLDCDEGEGYAVLHLRDELCMELHPSSMKERDVFHHQVWPRVVLEIRGDNRIQKSNKAVGGKMLEYWIWVANTARKNRRLHRTHHPNGTPSKLRQ